MRWWMMATMLAACAGTGGSDGTDGTDDPGPLPDPWADDLLLGPISDLGDLRVTGIRWSGWSAEGDVLAVVELRDGLRPVGQSLVTVGDEVEVLLDSAALQAEVGQNGLLDVRTDASGAISFETAGGCWMWFQDGALDGHCETDVYVDFRGPQLAGVQPVLVQQQDRLTYEAVKAVVEHCKGLTSLHVYSVDSPGETLFSRLHLGHHSYQVRVQRGKPAPERQA